MPNTYTELKRTVLSTSASTITLDNIPQNYTDLVLVFQCSAASANMNWDLRVGNGTVDSGSNYSATYLVGGSGGASSNRVSNQDRLRLGFSAFIQSSGGVFTAITQFMNYSNTTTNKTVISRDGNANQSVVEAATGLWRSTAAINIITMGDFGGSTMAAGTTVSLYGIANADLGAAKATGGIITEDSQYWYHTFGASGTFTPKQALTCEYVVVAGGGGGGYGAGGGGGGGGYRSSVSGESSGGGASAESSLSLLSATNYTVTIGAGGAAGTSGSPVNGGSNSVFATITSTGGGGGGSNYSSFNNNPTTGGSGGGGAMITSQAGAAGTTDQGRAGGNGLTTGNQGAGGGGGASTVGANGTSGVGGAGGTGVTSSIAGLSVQRAGGGGGAGGGGAGVGGAATGGGGGGANGSTPTTFASPGVKDAVVNTGGGGGGGFGSGGFPVGNGGSGVVIVRYAK
jgi:hypothetical protein